MIIFQWTSLLRMSIVRHAPKAAYECRARHWLAQDWARHCKAWALPVSGRLIVILGDQLILVLTDSCSMRDYSKCHVTTFELLAPIDCLC